MKGLQVLNPWHFRRKSRQPLTRDRAFTCEPPIYPRITPSMDCGLRQGCVKESHLHLENIPSKASAQHLHLLPLHPEMGGPWNDEDASFSSFLSQEKFRNKELLQENQCDLLSFLFAHPLPSHRHLTFQLQHEVCGLHWPAPSKCMQSRYCHPQLGPKAGCNSQIYPVASMLNPGLSLESL